MESSKPKSETVEQKEEKPKLLNRCLGISDWGEYCNEMLEKPEHFCPKCKARVKSIIDSLSPQETRSMNFPRRTTFATQKNIEDM